MNVGRPARAMLATDLDGTLVGDRAALARLNQDLARARGDLALVYVTGRVLASAQALIEAEALLRPDAIVAAVGTTFHLAPAWAEDPAWARRMAVGWDAAAVDAAAAALPALVPQPAAVLGPFKRSFWVAPDAVRAAVSALAHALARRGARARFVYSSDRDLDVLPIRGGKGVATLYAAARLGVAPERVVACGDSGNDVDLLGVGGQAALVANAGADLVRHAPRGAYLARAPYAGGVHEALRHFGVV